MENMGFEDTEGGKVSVRGNNNNGHFRKKKTGHLREEEKLHIYKNLLLISFSFLLLFTAYESMSKLQSSINSVANLGTWSNTAVYASLVFSTCFLPSIIINWLKAKRINYELSSISFFKPGQVDSGCQRVDLLTLYSGPVLPSLLHPHPHRLYPWPRSCPSLDSKVHLPHIHCKQISFE